LFYLFASEVHALGASQQSGGEAGNPLMNMLPFVLMFVIMYFLLIRPQYKKQKETQTMIDALKKGDRVVTNGGMHGTIAGVKEKEGILVIQVAKDVKIEISRGAVSKVVEKKES
jgi:preprotein translocase subunit YajC